MTPTIAASGVPSHLETPLTSVVDPPTDTRLQDLPFQELKWQDFEKLCLRLVRLDKSVEHTQQYGVGGQKQEGIDLYARRGDGGYSTYQCKREKKFDAPKIATAVSVFLESKWAAKCTEFVLCCMESFVETGRADEIEKQREILAAKNISFTTWDSVRLCEMLRSQPELVDAFFGRPWVKLFCGPEAADALTARRRMDASEVRDFRSALGKLYATVFNIHDPGLPSIGGAASAFPLQRRYILPEVEVAVDFGALEEVKPEHNPPSRAIGRSSGEELSMASTQSSSSSASTRSNQRQYQRRSLEGWLASSPRRIVLGEPGSGKSTLLRFVAIDLLDEAPCLGELAAQWGLYLPVWVPFGLWTKRLADSTTQDASLEDFLRSWLHNLGESRLWPIVEKALHDDRLLLLVDGLDEWKDEVAARSALGRLQVFVQQRETPIVLTCRPHGFERLQSLLPADLWPRGALASWTVSQQKQLALLWFEHRATSIAGGAQVTEEIARGAALTAGEFMNELGDSRDLHELAENPLLLSLLIAFKINDAHLPSSRFEVFDRTIRHLIETHPNHRRVAAALGGADLDLRTEDVQALFAHLAYEMQVREQFVALNEREAQHEVERFLRDNSIGRMGLSADKAHRIATSLLDIGEDTTGLLTEKAPQEVGFFHRAFQEFLAAKHLSEMDFSEQIQTVRQHCARPQWHEVILSLFLQLRRPNEVGQMLAVLQNEGQAANEADRYAITELLAKIVCGPFSAPVKERRQIVSDLCHRVELDSWQSHRERVLHSLLDGLRLPTLKEELQEQFRRWFPCIAERRGYLYWAMRRWPRTPEVTAQVEACLWRGLHDEKAENARGAARSYAAIFAEDEDARQRVAQLSARAVNPLTRAAALEALLVGWPAHPDTASAIDGAYQSLHPELRLIALKGRVQQKRHTEEDRAALLASVSGDGWLPSSFDGENDIVLPLLAGWPGSTELKRDCLLALQEHLFDITKRNILGAILLQGYPQDDEVVAFYLRDFNDDGDSFLSRANTKEWDWMRQNFADHPALVEAVDNLIQSKAHLSSSDLCFAALIGKTPVAKAKLLASLEGIENSDAPIWLGWSVRSLLDGWGMTDPEVNVLLKRAIKGAPHVVSGFAHFLPRIIINKKRCRARLLELLRDPASHNYDLVLQGLEQFGDTQSDTEIVDVVLGTAYEKRDPHEWSHSKVIPWLLINASQDARVKEIARQQVDAEVGYFVAAAHAFGDDEVIREALFKIASPLPSALRQLVAHRLCRGTGDAAFDEELLSNYHRDPDGEVKIASAIGYYTRLKSHWRNSPEQVEGVLDRLRQGLRKGAPVDFDLACASYAGLMILDRLDVVEQFKAQSDHFHLLLEPPNTNPAFVGFVLENWDKHRAFLKDDFWRVHQLTSHDSDYDQQRFWEAVAPFVDPYPTAREEMLQFIQSKNGQIKEDGILQFLARTRSQSPLLLESCFWNLGNGYSGRIAAQILGTQFSGNQEVLTRLTQDQLPWNNEPTLKDYFEEGEIIAVCEGWPNHQLLSRWLQRLSTLPWKSPEKHVAGRLDVIGAFFSVICCKATSQIVRDSLQHLLSTYPLLDKYDWAAPFVVRPLRQRLAKDAGLVQSLLSLLQSTTNPSEKATLAGLLHSVNTISTSVEEWCRDELKTQMSQAPEVGFDLLSNQIKPIPHIIFEVLQSTRSSS